MLRATAHTRSSSGSTPQRSASARSTAPASVDELPRPALPGTRRVTATRTHGLSPSASASRATARHTPLLSTGTESAGEKDTAGSGASSTTTVSYSATGAMRESTR